MKIINKLFGKMKEAPSIVIVPIKKLDNIREDVENKLAQSLDKLLSNDKTKEKLSDIIAQGINAGIKSGTGLSCPDAVSGVTANVIADFLIKAGYCVVKQLEK
jgi:hypothetical protein